MMYAETQPTIEIQHPSPNLREPMTGSVAPLPIAGYTTQTPPRFGAVNINKQLEEVVLQRLDDLAASGEADPRWLAIGRTGLEQAFMAINRAIMQPQRVKLAGDLTGSNVAA